MLAGTGPILLGETSPALAGEKIETCLQHKKAELYRREISIVIILMCKGCKVSIVVKNFNTLENVADLGVILCLRPFKCLEEKGQD